jgi:hypothetical protein
MKNRMLRSFVIAVLVLSASPLLKAQSSGEDYLDAPELIRKWPAKNMPIVVYIQPDNGAPDHHENYSKIAKQAFDEWASASKGSYAFDFVDDPGRANIDLTWTTDQSKLPVHDEVFKSGTCQFSFSTFGIDGAKIMVLTNDPEKGGAVSDNLIHRICLHEIGHALGLSHSPSQGDVMFARYTDPMKDIVPVLSERDQRTITMLYSDAVKPAFDKDATMKAGRDKGMKMVSDKETDAMFDAANRGDFKVALEISERQFTSNPTLTVCKANYVAVLNKAANAAMATKSFDTAYDYYEQALKVDPQSDVTRQNLARCLLLKGTSLIRANKLAEAELCFKKALDVVPDTQKEMRRYIVHNYSVALEGLGRKQEADQLMTKYAVAP